MLKKVTIFSVFIVTIQINTVVFASEEPDWLKRISLNTEIETDKQPTFYLETVQPLRQSLDKINTYFIQPRVSMRGGDFTYNLGAGYRKLQSENLLWGINIFGDYADLHEHGRAGVGFEALGQKIEARLNSYFGITSKRIVEEQGGVVSIYERVADGLDLEAGTPIPYLPWLKIYGSGFFYNFRKANDKFGWKSRLESRVTDWCIIDLYVWDDNKGETEFGGKLEAKIPFDKWSDIKNAFKFAKTPYAEKDLTEYTLIPVERNFDIVVEKWSESANSNITVRIGRGN